MCTNWGKSMPLIIWIDFRAAKNYFWIQTYIMYELTLWFCLNIKMFCLVHKNGIEEFIWEVVQCDSHIIKKTFFLSVLVSMVWLSNFCNCFNTYKCAYQSLSSVLAWKVKEESVLCDSRELKFSVFAIQIPKGGKNSILVNVQQSK